MVLISNYLRTALRALLLAALPLIASACIDETRIVQVYPDGSGIYIVQTVLSPEFIERMNKGKGTYPIEKPNIHELREAAPRYGEGVTFSSVVEIETEFGKGYEAQYEFTDVNLFHLTPNARNKPSNHQFTTFTLQRGSPAELIIHWPADERISMLGVFLYGQLVKARENAIETAQRQPPEDQAAILEKLLKMLGMRSALYVEAMGRIIESDATYLNVNNITLGRIAYREIMENEEAMSRVATWERDPSVEETVEFIKLVPNQMIETKPEIHVRFR